MNSSRQPIYRFGEIEVDPSKGCLRRNGQEHYLRQKTFQVLLYLLQHRDRLVTKQELLEQIWAQTLVTDGTLVNCIAEIRKALDDDSRDTQLIKTISKMGYRFIGPLEEFSPEQPAVVTTEKLTSVEIEVVEEIIKNDALPAPVQPSAFITRSFGSLRRHPAWLLVIGVILVLAVALPAYFGFRFWRAVQPQAETRLPQIPGKKPLVVMYFENQSGSRELDWLREGLADMLIVGLSRSKGLTVLSRQQLHLLLKRTGDEKADQLPLDKALEVAEHSQAEVMILGSFAQAGEKLRIDVQLHDARSGQFIAAESLIVDRPEQILVQVDLLSLKLAERLGAPTMRQDQQVQLADAMTNSLEAYRDYLLALEKAHAYHSTEAIALLEKAITLDPQFAMAYARIGYIYAMVRVNEGTLGKPYLEKAFRLAHRLTEKDRLYITAWYAYAHQDRERAMAAFRDLIAHYPQEVEAYLRLGYLLAWSDRWEEARAVYKQGLVIDPENPDLYNALGLSSITSDEAIAAHQRYVQLAPQEPNAHDSLGVSLNRAGRYAEALAEFNRALALKPDFHFAHRHLGDTYFLLGRYRAASEEYHRYIQLAPADWDRAYGHHLLALLYWKRGDLQRAEAFAQQELKYKNNFGGPFLIALARGDLKTAESLKEPLIGHSPSPQQGNTATARQTLYWRGYYALKHGRADEAVAHFKQALGTPLPIWSIESIEDCLANAYLVLERLDEAITEYERLLSTNRSYALAHYHLGVAYERTGQRERARIAFARFLEIWKDADPDIPEVIAAKQRLANF